MANSICEITEDWIIAEVSMIDDVKQYRGIPESRYFLRSYITVMWSGGVMVRAMACYKRSREFNSQPFHCQVTTLGKLFTYVPLSPSSIIWYQSWGSDVLQLGK